MKKVWFIVSLALGIGFGFPAAPLRATQFVYVASQTSNNVSGYSIDRKTGALAPVPGSPFLTGAGPGPDSVAVDVRAQFVYEAGGDSLSVPGTVSGYSIDRKTGALTPVPGSPFPTESEPFSVAITGH